MPRLASPALSNHSLYGAFQVRKEDRGVLFRGKRYAYDEEWLPECGILLMKEDTQYEPIKAAEINMESIKLDIVFMHLQTKLYPILGSEEKVLIQSNWDWLREKLENLERNHSTLPTLKLADLPKQILSNLGHFEIPSNLEPIVNEGAVPELRGNYAPDEDVERNDVEVGQDVVIWTKSKRDRCAMRIV